MAKNRAAKKAMNMLRGDLNQGLDELSQLNVNLRRTATATENTARGVQSDVEIALDERRNGATSVPASGRDERSGSIEKTVRALTRWQGNDSGSLIRALQASFERTESNGRQVIRYRGAGRLVPSNGAAHVGPRARQLRLLTPNLGEIRDLLVRLEPVNSTDLQATKSLAAAISDRLDSYADELGRGFDAREARLRALRVALRGNNNAVRGGLLKKLYRRLGFKNPPASESEELLADDFFTLEQFVFNLDGTAVPAAAPSIGPAEWRDGVDEELARLSDDTRELQTRLYVFGFTPAQLEAENVKVGGEVQSVADVLSWIDDLVQRDAPRLLEETRRAEARRTILSELDELTLWVKQLPGLNMFNEQLLKTAARQVRQAIKQLRSALRRN
jgi:hypothetical protein